MHIFVQRWFNIRGNVENQHAWFNIFDWLPASQISIVFHLLSPFTSTAARIPDSMAPSIQPGVDEVCSPAK